MEVSRWVHVLMLLGARVLIVEVGTYKYGMGEGKKEPGGWTGIGGIDGNSWYQKNKYVCVYVYICAHM